MIIPYNSLTLKEKSNWNYNPILSLIRLITPELIINQQCRTQRSNAAKQPAGIPIKGHPGDCAEVIPDLELRAENVGWCWMVGSFCVYPLSLYLRKTSICKLYKFYNKPMLYKFNRSYHIIYHLQMVISYIIGVESQASHGIEGRPPARGCMVPATATGSHLFQFSLRAYTGRWAHHCTYIYSICIYIITYTISIVYIYIMNLMYIYIYICIYLFI